MMKPEGWQESGFLLTENKKLVQGGGKGKRRDDKGVKGNRSASRLFYAVSAEGKCLG